MAGEVSGGLVALNATERDALLLGNLSEHLGGLRIKLIAQEVGHRQRACDARAERLGDQLDTSRTDVLVGRVHRHDLAVLVAADGRKDGTPALVPELVAPELDGRQRAISSECWS